MGAGQRGRGGLGRRLGVSARPSGRGIGVTVFHRETPVSVGRGRCGRWPGDGDARTTGPRRRPAGGGGPAAGGSVGDATPGRWPGRVDLPAWPRVLDHLGEDRQRPASTTSGPLLARTAPPLGPAQLIWCNAVVAAAPGVRTSQPAGPEVPVFPTTRISLVAHLRLSTPCPACGTGVPIATLAAERHRTRSRASSRQKYLIEIIILLLNIF